MTTKASTRDDEGEKQLTELAHALRKLEPTFACGGSLELDAAVELRLRDGRAIPIVRDEGWTRAGVSKKLMKLCQPAPFGHGRVTRHDREVRDGWQLSAANGAFRVHGLDLTQHGVLAEVQRALCPGAALPPTAELYALNLYPVGGHFVTHKDTPRDRDVFGTLVVCLPVPFRGGRLVLRHDTERRYDWELPDYYGYRPQDQAYKVQWAAFYGDVDHAVEAVTSGTRVTVTWLLRRANGSEVTRPVPAASESDLEAALVKALEDPDFLPSGGTLGIPCTHLYPEVPGLVGPADTLSRAAAGRLKGRDGMIARAALQVGLQARYRPYLFENSGDESWRLSRAPSAREASIFDCDRLGESELEATMPIEHHVDWNRSDDVTWVLSPPWRRRAERDPSRDAVPAAQPLGALEYSATDYFGNEAGDAVFYLSAVLLVEVPPTSRRATVPHRAATLRGSDARIDANRAQRPRSRARA